MEYNIIFSQFVNILNLSLWKFKDNMNCSKRTLLFIINLNIMKTQCIANTKHNITIVGWDYDF